MLQELSQLNISQIDFKHNMTWIMQNKEQKN